MPLLQKFLALMIILSMAFSIIFIKREQPNDDARFGSGNGKYHKFIINRYKKYTLNSRKCIDRTKNKDALLISYGYRESDIKSNAKNVLIIGSGGPIGTRLKLDLENKGYNVLYSMSRQHLDVRDPNSLSIFDSVDFSFVFLLADDFGGELYNENPKNKPRLLSSNLQIVTNSVKYLRKRKLRFIFVSSLPQSGNNLYVYTKRLGEKQVIDSYGKVARFPLVLGFEYPSEKTRDINRIIHQCLINHNASSSFHENDRIQMVNSKDVSEVLIHMMTNYNEYQSINEFTLEKDYQINEIVSIIHEYIPECDIFLSNKSKAHVIEETTNLKQWKPKYSIIETLRETIISTNSTIYGQSPKLSIIIYAHSFNEKDMNNIRHSIKVMEDQVKMIHQPVKIMIASEIFQNSTKFPIEYAYCSKNVISMILPQIQTQNVLIVSPYIIPSIQQLQFLTKYELPDLIFYYSEHKSISNMSVDFGNQIVIPKQINSCDSILDYPNINDFIAASKYTFQSVGYPSGNISLLSWLMRFETGFNLIPFSSPSFSLSNIPSTSYENIDCCHPYIDDLIQKEEVLWIKPI